MVVNQLVFTHRALRKHKLSHFPIRYYIVNYRRCVLLPVSPPDDLPCVLDDLPCLDGRSAL